MHILTALGWKPLSPKNYTKAPDDDGRYRGPLPSLKTLAFIAEREEEIRLNADLRERLGLAHPAV